MQDQKHFDHSKIDELDRSKLPTDGGKEYYRLISCQSPYLLQHATNPVNWYSWCDEAFELVRSEDKPLNLCLDYGVQ